MQRRCLIGLAILLGATVSVGAQQAIFTDEIYLGSQPCRMLSGAGSPEGHVVASPCSTYYRTSDGMIWRKATGTGNTGWVEVGLPTGAANQVLFHNGSAIAFSGTPSVTSLTASSSLSSPQLTASGNLEIDPTGDLTLDPGGNDVLPGSGYTDNFGSFSRKWLTLHAAELWVSTLVAQDVMSTIGGRVVIAPTTELAADLASGGTSISVKHNNLAIGDRLFLEGNGMFEAMAVTSGPSGSGPYTYSVTRNLDGSGANNWPAGSAVLNTGTTGDGFIDLYADNGLVAGSTFGPTIVGNVRTGTAYNAVAPRWAIGNLNGLYGYATDTYGAAFGDPSGEWLKIDASEGIRMGSGSTTLIDIDDGNASFTGTITAGAGSIGAWEITKTALLSGAIMGIYPRHLTNQAAQFGDANSAIYRASGYADTDNFAIGGWFYVSEMPTTTRYGVSNGTIEGGYGLYISSTAGEWRGNFIGTTSSIGAGGCPVTVGAWMHVVLVRRGGTGMLFCNGNQVGTTTAGAPSAPAGDYFTIGGIRNAADTGFQSGLGGSGGRAAYVFRVQNYQLSDAEVAAMYSGGPSGAGLAGWLALTGNATLFRVYPLQSDIFGYVDGRYAHSASIAGTVTLGADGPTVYGEMARVEVGTGTNRSGIAECQGNIAFWSGARYRSRGSAPFRVECDGTLYATDANITGTVTATSGSFTGTVSATTLTSSNGTIGGWSLSASALTATNLTLTSGASNVARVQIGSGGNAGGLNSCAGSGDVGLWIGSTHANRGAAPFRVTCAGALTATNAFIAGRFETDYIVMSNTDGITFDNASSDGDTARSINWQNGSRIWTRTSPNSMTLRGPTVGTYSQINLYPNYMAMWGGAGSVGVYLDQTQFAPDGTLNLGSNADRWRHGYIEGITLYDQFPITLNHANFRSGNQYLCVDSAGRVFASPLGC